MIDALLIGISEILKPWPLTLMALGILGSSFFAALPGIGVLLLITIVLPFAITLDPYAAIAFLLGIGAVSNTANTFPSVLIAVPGSAGSQATIVDGFPMAQKGEAKRAFGAAFVASPLGGIFGAAVLFLSLPILKPLVLSFGSPEILMLVIWGLSAVGVLSGTAPIKGLIAAIIGVFISTIGMDNKTGVERFSFEGEYLVDGISLILVGLGLFAVPEMIALARRRTSIAETEGLGHGLLEGIKDVFRNKWLAIRCSVIGVWVGVLPGLGASVADWFAYAHAVQTEKNPEKFGKGDVRGVIAPESANNAKEGGALIPTIAFGIPGSTSLALILIAFISVGITPGSAMLTDQLPYTMAMIFVLVIANIFAAGLAIGAAGQFAKLSLMPFYIFVPMTLVLCVSAAYAAHFVWWDILTFLVFSVLGYVMKVLDWPRPPLLVAVVLGGQLETYLWLSNARYGWEWLTGPGVIAILILIILTLLMPFIRSMRQKKSAPASVDGDVVLSKTDRLWDIGFLIFVGCLLTAAAYVSTDWVLRGALVIYFLAGLGVPLGILQILLHWRWITSFHAKNDKPVITESSKEGVVRSLQAFAWLFALAAGVWFVGFHIAAGAFVVLFIRHYKGKWIEALVIFALSEIFVVAVFDILLNVFWPTPALFELFGLTWL